VSNPVVDSTLWPEMEHGVGAEISQSGMIGVLNVLKRQYHRVLVLLGCHYSSATLVKISNMAQPYI
jgi:hypothetical protein